MSDAPERIWLGPNWLEHHTEVQTPSAGAKSWLVEYVRVDCTCGRKRSDPQCNVCDNDE